jgi:hypothetical protein
MPAGDEIGSIILGLGFFAAGMVVAVAWGARRG